MVDDVRGYRYEHGYGALVYDRQGRLIDNNDSKKECVEYKRRNHQTSGKYKRNQCKSSRAVLCVSAGQYGYHLWYHIVSACGLSTWNISNNFESLVLKIKTLDLTLQICLAYGQ